MLRLLRRRSWCTCFRAPPRPIDDGRKSRNAQGHQAPQGGCLLTFARRWCAYVTVPSNQRCLAFRLHHHAHPNAFVHTSPTTAPRCGARLGLVSRRTRPVLRPHLLCFARASPVPPPLAPSRGRAVFPGARQARVGCLGLCVPVEHHADDSPRRPKHGCLERAVLPRVVNLVLRNTAVISLGWSSLLLQ
jgi:hypothetical protein